MKIYFSPFLSLEMAFFVRLRLNVVVVVVIVVVTDLVPLILYHVLLLQFSIPPCYLSLSSRPSVATFVSFSFNPISR